MKKRIIVVITIIIVFISLFYGIHNRYKYEYFDKYGGENFFIYKHLLEITFKDGSSTRIYVTTSDKYINNHDIDTHRESNPNYNGYIDVYGLETITTEFVEEDVFLHYIDSTAVLFGILMVLGIAVLVIYGIVYLCYSFIKGEIE